MAPVNTRYTCNALIYTPLKAVHTPLQRKSWVWWHNLLILAPRKRGAVCGGVSEFEASLIFIVSSRTARMKLCLEKKTEGKEGGRG